MPSWTPAPYSLPYITGQDVLEQTPSTNEAQIRKISQYLEQLEQAVSDTTPIGTVIPWGLPFADPDPNTQLEFPGPYGNVSKFAPFHLPATGGVYPTDRAPLLASALGHTYAPYSGGKWATVDASGNGLPPGDPNGEIVAFWEESDLGGPFPDEPLYDLGENLPWKWCFALCFFGQWTNARVVQYVWSPTHNSWGWHFYAGDGDLTRAIDHEIVGGEYMPKVYNGKTGARYPIKAHNASTNALEDVDESGVYEFEFEPGGANIRQWNVITHDGFVVPDFRGRSPFGAVDYDDPSGIGNRVGVTRDVLLGGRAGDWRLHNHYHRMGDQIGTDGDPFSPYALVSTYQNAGAFPGTGSTSGQIPLGPGLQTYGGWRTSYINEQGDDSGTEHNMPPLTGTNFLVFAGERISDPTPMPGTGSVRNGEPVRLHSVTTESAIFRRLADSDLSEYEREMLTAQLNGEPWPPTDDS